MTCVGAIALSGLFLYWEHVDGPSLLFTTMYGRVLGVKILIFGGLLLLGMANQFWLHPRIEALRTAGDTRPLRVLLLREFPIAVALPPKTTSTSTWIYGTGETLLVILVMAGGYRVSGRIARGRSAIHPAADGEVALAEV